MKNTSKILFYLKRNAQRKNGFMPIIARVTINGKIAQFSTKLEIYSNNWSVQIGKPSERSREEQQINMLLEQIDTISMTSIQIILV